MSLVFDRKRRLLGEERLLFSPFGTTGVIAATKGSNHGFCLCDELKGFMRTELHHHLRVEYVNQDQAQILLKARSLAVDETRCNLGFLGNKIYVDRIYWGRREKRFAFLFLKENYLQSNFTQHFLDRLFTNKMNWPRPSPRAICKFRSCVVVDFVT